MFYLEIWENIDHEDSDGCKISQIREKYYLQGWGGGDPL